MAEKHTININKSVFKVVVTSIVMGVMTVFIVNLFSKEWYYQLNKNDYRYSIWTEGSDSWNDPRLKGMWRYGDQKQTPITAYSFNSIFGSSIYKYGYTGYVWDDFKGDGWVKGTFDRGKFSNPIQTFYFQVLLTAKDWLYILLFSVIIVLPRLFFRKFRFKLKD